MVKKNIRPICFGLSSEQIHDVNVYLVLLFLVGVGVTSNNLIKLQYVNSLQEFSAWAKEPITQLEVLPSI